MKILIGGESGFIGKHLSRLLISKGHEVIPVSRRSQPNTLTWTNLYENGLPPDVKAVVNLAGQNLMAFPKRWTPSFEAELRSSRIDTTKQLADLIEQSSSPPEVFVSASAVGYYPPSQDKIYTENSEGGDGNFLAQLCKDWENASKLSHTKCRQVTIRIGLALGRDGGTIQKMILPFWFGVGGRIGSGQQWFPWVHVDDVAGIFCHAIEQPHVSGVLNATAPEHITNAEFTTSFASALWRPAVFPVPAFVMKLALGDVRATAVLEGQRVSPQKVLENGYKFLYPDIKSACREFAHIIPNFRTFSA